MRNPRTFLITLFALAVLVLTTACPPDRRFKATVIDLRTVEQSVFLEGTTVKCSAITLKLENGEYLILSGNQLSAPEKWASLHPGDRISVLFVGMMGIYQFDIIEMNQRELEAQGEKH